MSMYFQYIVNVIYQYDVDAMSMGCQYNVDVMLMQCSSDINVIWLTDMISNGASDSDVDSLFGEGTAASFKRDVLALIPPVREGCALCWCSPLVLQPLHRSRRARVFALRGSAVGGAARQV